MEVLNQEEELKFNILQFIDIWPLPVDKVNPLLKRSEKLIAVEGNSTAQLADLIRMKTGIEMSEKILKYDGRPFSPEYIINKLKEVV